MGEANLFIASTNESMDNHLDKYLMGLFGQYLAQHKAFDNKGLVSSSGIGYVAPILILKSRTYFQKQFSLKN